MKREVADTPTAERILDVAEAMIQTRGFNGFSYADIAGALGIRKPSIHHHFPTKAAMGERLIARYAKRFQDALDEIDACGVGEMVALRRYTELYRDVLRNQNRMCLCGMMAAEILTLPQAVRRRINLFFDANETWLSAVLDRGRRAGRLAFRGKPVEVARRLISSLEGAMLVSRAYDDEKRFERHATALLKELKP